MNENRPEDSYPQIPTGPIESGPWDYVGRAHQRRALLDALDGIELGAYDRRILDWLSGWEWSIVVVVSSLITRARTAGQTSS